MSEILKEQRESVQEIPFILRILWFIIFGWELAAGWIVVAWALNLTIIGLPLGLWMIDRVPQVLTLKARSGEYVTNPKTGATRYESVPQTPFLLRVFYFLLIGWWFSLIWAAIGWLLCVIIIGLPLGLPMLHALPFVTTLHRN